MVLAHEICKALHLPIDLILVRKLGVPGQEELAFGSIATGDIIEYNADIVTSLALTNDQITPVIAKETAELNRRDQVYRGDRPPLDLHNQSVILVDDGLATGATMRSAISAAKKLGAQSICVALPVASRASLSQIKPSVDEVVCLATPEPFYAIGQFYQNFPQNTDEEVIAVLNQH